MKEEIKPLDPDCRRKNLHGKQEKLTELLFERDKISC